MRRLLPYATALALALALTSCSDPVSVESGAAPAGAVETSTSTTSTSTSTTALPTTVEATTSTTAAPAPVTSTSQVTPATLPPATLPPTTVWIEPEPLEDVPEPEYIPEPEPVYEPSGSGCVIPAYICERESGHSYTALNPSSGAGGMYQFMPSTWNGVARQIGMPEWVGTPPHTAPPWVQDTFALYLWDGGAGCYHWSAC